MPQTARAELWRYDIRHANEGCVLKYYLVTNKVFSNK